MKVRVVGCSGSYPGPDSAASCYLIEVPRPGGAPDEHSGKGRSLGRSDDPAEEPFRLLVDLGSGALGALQRHVDPLLIDAVLISHLHPDHFFDLSGYYVMRKYHPGGPARQLPVYGPRGLRTRMARAYGLPRNPGMSGEFDFRRIRRQSRIGPLVVTARRVDHPVEAFAFRIEHAGAAASRSVVYSGDTARCRALTDLARGADLLLAEAAFRDGADNPPHVHMTGSDAGRVAAEAGAARLVLTHVPPWHDAQVAVEEARGAFAGPTGLATEGATYEV